MAYGTEDLLTPAALAEELAAAILGSRLEPIPSAGHFSNPENPAAANRLILEQLGRSCDHTGRA